MMDLVKKSPGCAVKDLCEHFDMSRIAVMKHLQVLVDAKLIISRKQGRTRELFFNVAPIQMIHDRWSSEYSRFWASQAVDLKYKVEQAQREKKAKQSSDKSSASKKGNRKK
jgi:DNA-binding transcriptional ArsR family regulator